MSPVKQEVINSIELISIFFILLVSIVIITAVLYHNRKKVHRADLANFENLLTQTHYEVQEQTLQTIGVELHDNIGQLLSLTALMLGSVEFEHPEKVSQKVDDAYELILRSIKEMRMLGKLFQGDQLIADGLVTALNHEISWISRSGKYEISFETDGTAPTGPDTDKDLILFRIFQEIVNNIIKHASATRIDISLKFVQDTVTLRIRDNGIGFDIAGQKAETSMGLANIKRRTAILGGKVTISSVLNEGTQLSIIIPYS